MTCWPQTAPVLKHRAIETARLHANQVSSLQPRHLMAKPKGLRWMRRSQLTSALLEAQALIKQFFDKKVGDILKAEA